jgi:DNA-directed RNA polymerase subunit A"
MTIDKLLDEFRKENPEFPNYILEDVKAELPAKTSDSDVKKVLEVVKKEYYDSLISPHEAIGVVAAQSVGAEATQMTLNTFHFAGVASQSVEGLPRLIEILDMKKSLSQPMMKLYLKKDKKLSDEKIKLLAKKIKETKLAEFVTSTEILMDDNIVEIVLDTKALSKLDIDPEKIVSYLDRKIKKFASLEENKLTIKGEKVPSLKRLMEVKELALSSIVYGVKGIKDISIMKEEGEVVFYTQGIALKAMMKFEELDINRLYCNSVEDMYNLFGIEAARNTIIKEIKDVVASQGLSINDRHVLLIADAMTYTGEPRGMTRYGIVADKLNVLTRASFETPLKHIARGALLNEENKLSSITENVMTNQMVNVGTGMVRVAVKKNK